MSRRHLWRLLALSVVSEPPCLREVHYSVLSASSVFYGRP